MRLACISGNNGEGKSALLDAITWSLWGKARARSDNELIHLGQTEMAVTFTFGLGENVYRVLRRRKQGGKSGQTLLDLQVQHGDEWRSMGEASVRETQAKIERLLRLAAALADPRWAAIVSPAAAKGPDALRDRVLGTGPFTLDVWDTGAEIRLRRHASFFRAGRPATADRPDPEGGAADAGRNGRTSGPQPFERHAGC